MAFFVFVFSLFSNQLAFLEEPPVSMYVLRYFDLLLRVSHNIVTHQSYTRTKPFQLFNAIFLPLSLAAYCCVGASYEGSALA